MSEHSITRRGFLKGTGLAVGGTLAAGAIVHAGEFRNETLQVWSCGGLAEAMVPANSAFEKQFQAGISYTGAFAAALGKSLLGSAQTEVFAPRVLGLAQKLREQGKMVYFRPLCFTQYVVAVRRGNPSGIRGIEDFNRDDVKAVLAPDASPPGGKACMLILKKAGVDAAAVRNAVTMGDCVQTAIPDLIAGRGDAAIIEKRITRLPEFRGKLDIIDIPEAFIPPVPVPFTIGRMKWAKNPELADAYIEFILSPEGQKHFEAAGFIPAFSPEGKRLAEKYGVKDV